ncbi:MAG TPA: ABC transporter permease, partial [Actinobacteria bacterium]|nr:ABC transporter permease [Actinomycetota bacterium]
GSAALIRSRMLGVSRRMVATPTPIRTIVVGEAMGRFGVAMVQGLFIVLGTWLVFGVDWGDPLGTGAVLVMFSLVSAGAAMLIGSLFRNDAQAGGIGVLLGLGFGALGGCMVPLQVFQIFSPGLYTAAHITPHAWALEAFIEMVQRGGGLVDILPELAILGGYAVVFLGLASWALHRSLTRP